MDTSSQAQRVDTSSQAQRRIGAIFVDKGHISEEQLTSAVEEQQATGQKLGEILIARYGLSRLDLAGALAERWAEDEAALISHPTMDGVPTHTHDEIAVRLARIETGLTALTTELTRLREQLAAGRGDSSREGCLDV